MGLFSKKLSLDDILKGIDALSPDEKEKVKAKVADLDKAEDEREIDKIEEEKADNAEVADEKGEEVNEESKEIGKDVDEVEETANEAETETEEPTDTQQDALAADNEDHIIKGLTDRVTALEDAIKGYGDSLKELDGLKKMMEDYTAKQAKQFGYSGAVPGAKKSMEEMSAAELKRSILNGEN